MSKKQKIHYFIFTNSIITWNIWIFYQMIKSKQTNSLFLFRAFPSIFSGALRVINKVMLRCLFCFWDLVSITPLSKIAHEIIFCYRSFTCFRGKKTFLLYVSHRNLLNKWLWNSHSLLSCAYSKRCNINGHNWDQVESFA